jgi:hypothetical protein
MILSSPVLPSEAVTVTKRLGSSVAVVHQRRKQSGQESALTCRDFCDFASRHKGSRDTSCRYVESQSAIRIPWRHMIPAPQTFYSRETLTPLTCPTEDISSILSSLLNSSWFVFLSSSRLSTKTDVGSARRWLAEGVESMRLFLFSDMREENRLRWDRMAGNAV